MELRYLRGFIAGLFLWVVIGWGQSSVSTNGVTGEGENSTPSGEMHVAVLPTPEAEAQRTAVVYNTRHPGSEKIAKHYAEMRKIPEANLIPIFLDHWGGVPREDYADKLEGAILDALSQKGLLTLDKGTPGTNQIRYLVLCRGIPFIIHDKREQCTAAVDSELASVVLRRLNGFSEESALRNPAQSNPNPTAISPETGVLMVARLDGPSDEIANALVDKAVQAEKQGLWGSAYLDIRGLTNTGYLQGDEWIKNAGLSLYRYGYNTFIDSRPETFSGGSPMPSVAFYAGWYDIHASGPFKSGLVEFSPGAFAYHLHSFSAVDIESPTNYWVGPLLARGATCTVGYVSEPFLSQTLNVDSFTDWFLRGASFGESAYHSLAGLSWQATVIGDPLYRPFRVNGLNRFLQTQKDYPELAGWIEVQLVNLNIIKDSENIPKLVKHLEESLQKLPKDFALAERLALYYKGVGLQENALKVCRDILKIPDALTPVQRCFFLSLSAEILVQNESYVLANNSFKELYKAYPSLGAVREFLTQWESVAKEAKAREDSKTIKALLKQLPKE